MQKTAIIIPCFNEFERLASDRFLEFVQKNRSIDFIFVNDGSADQTGVLIDQLQSSSPDRFYCIHLERNLGKAGAVREGFLKAFSKEYDAVGFWDADLATPLDIIPKFCRVLESPVVHMVFGSRVKLLSHNIDRKASRHYLGRIFATLASLVLGMTIYDTQCGAKLFQNTEELRHVFSTPFTVSWIFDIEIMARFQRLSKETGATSISQTAYEYPLEQWRDVPGSKLQIKDFFRAVFELVKVALYLRC